MKAHADQYVARVWSEQADKPAWLALLSYHEGIRKRDRQETSINRFHGGVDSFFGLSETEFQVQWSNSQCTLRGIGEAISDARGNPLRSPIRFHGSDDNLDIYSLETLPKLGQAQGA